LRRPRKRCSSTGGIEISDDDRFADDFDVKIPRDGSKGYESLYDGYLVDDDGKVVGEARRYDPYSRFGHIMLYEVDSFGFVPGFISKGVKLMSKEDLKSDRRLNREFKESQYQVWKRYNVMDLIREYDTMLKNKETFDKFCREAYRKTRHLLE
jgi:hypothetical protein